MDTGRPLWCQCEDNVPRRAAEVKARKVLYTCHEGDDRWEAVDPIIRAQEEFDAIRATKPDWDEPFGGDE